MYNDLNQHKKSDAVKWVIVFILIAVLLVGMAASLTLTLSDKEEEKGEQAQEQAYANDFTAECISTANVKLAMNSVAMLAEDNSVSKTLTATVYPTDATNKLVDWSIEWSNPLKQEEVTDYVTVTLLTTEAVKQLLLVTSRLVPTRLRLPLRQGREAIRLPVSYLSEEWLLLFI